jgi:cysteine dioxygenase
MALADTCRDFLIQAAKAPDRPTPFSLVENLAAEAERYLDRIRFDPAQYVRHAILLWEDWEVMLIAWQQGQITPIHDHRGVLGGMAVLSGALVEERFTTPGDKPSLVDSRVRPEGDLCDTGPAVLHRLIPQSARAVSLHIYRPPLRTMGIWNDEGLKEIRGSVFEVREDEFERLAVR